MTKVLSHQLRPLLTTAPCGGQRTCAEDALIDSTCLGTSSLVQEAARSLPQMLDNADGSPDMADAALPETAAAADEHETAPPSPQETSHQPDQQGPLTDAAQLEREAVHTLCSNLLGGSRPRPSGCTITWGHRSHKKRRKDQAAGETVQRALKRQTAMPSRSVGKATASTGSSEKYSQPHPTSYAVQHVQKTAAELEGENTDALQQLPPAEPVSEAPAAVCTSSQRGVASHAQTGVQQQPSQLLVKLGQVLLELRRQREARNSLGPQQQQQQQHAVQSFAESAEAQLKAGGNGNGSLPSTVQASAQHSKAAQLSQLLRPGLQALVAASTPTPPDGPPAAAEQAAAAVMHGNGVNDSSMPAALSQKQHLLTSTAAADSRSSSPLLSPAPADGHNQGNTAGHSSAHKLPVHQLPQAMRVSYLRAAGFLPPDPAARKPANSPAAKSKRSQQATSSMPRKRCRRTHDSDSPVVGWEERSYMQGSDRGRVWEEHQMVLRVLQVALADDSDALACVHDVSEVFKARSCVSCWRARPTNGTWFCSKTTCWTQHCAQYGEHESVTAASKSACDEAHWQEVKKVVQPVLAERKQQQKQQSEAEGEGDGTAAAELVGSDGTAAPEVAPASAGTEVSNAVPNGAERQIAGSASSAATSTSPALNDEQQQTTQSSPQQAGYVTVVACKQQGQYAAGNADAEGKHLDSSSGKTTSSTVEDSLQSAPAAAVAAAEVDAVKPRSTSSAAAADPPAGADVISSRSAVECAAVNDATATAAAAAADGASQPGPTSGAAAAAAGTQPPSAAAAVYTPPEVPIQNFILPEKEFKYPDLKRLWAEHQLHMRVLLIELQDKPNVLARVQDVINKVTKRVCLRCLNDAGHRPSTGSWFCGICQRSWGKAQNITDADAWQALITGTGIDAKYKFGQRNPTIARLLEQGQVVQQQRMNQPGTLLFYAPISVSGPMLAGASYAPPAVTTAAATVSGGSKLPAVPAVLAAAPAGPSD